MDQLLRMPWTRRNLLAAAGGLAAGWALWRPSQPWAATPRPGGTLRVSVSVRCTTINPLNHSSLSEYMASEMLYSGLTRLELNMAPVGDLAQSWTANGDATEFVFKLRPGVVFHHGPELTAEDVVATIKAVLDPKTSSPARSAIGPVADAIADDKLTVRIKLKSPFADLPVALAHPNVRIVPAAIIAEGITQLQTKDFGTGPFKLDTFDSSRLLRVVRFDKYFLPGRPYLDAVEQVLFPDLPAEAANFLGRQTDLVLEVPQADYKRISSSPGVVGLRQKSGRFANLVMRFDQKPFDDPRVRRALAMSIDRQAMVDLVLEGYGRPSYDNAISPEYRYYVETPKVAYDPPGAKKLLAEAGYPGGIKTQLICSNRPSIRTQFGVAVKELAKAGGFDIDVQTIPHDNYLETVWKKAAFYVGYWNMRPTEDSMYTLLFTADSSFEDTGWKNKEFDDLAAQARRITDDGERKRIYAQTQALMVRDLPYIIPFYQDILTAHHPWVMDYSLHPLQLGFYFDRVWLGDGAPKRG
ncbi:MAG: ABC transporter substrate-binding protein [Proteobacteria bacterium]|nr:ABC transporter substrate-binding protein [Pseudomonadota bacterium]